jgi:hypothetical protein
LRPLAPAGAALDGGLGFGSGEDILNNRQIASIVWLGLLVVGFSFTPGVRDSFKALLGVCAHWKIWLPFLCLAAWVIGLVYVGWRVDLWTINLTADTAFWFVASAIVLLANINSAINDSHYFRRVARRTIELTLLIEFALNIYVLPLPAELILQPVFIFAVAVIAFAEKRSEFRSVKSLLQILTGFFTVGIIAYSAAEIARHWRDLNVLGLTQQLISPVWLTIGTLPLIYLIAVLGGYESAFLHIKFASDDRCALWKVRAALLLEFRGKTSELAGFSTYWAGRAIATNSIRGARAEIRECRNRKLLRLQAEQAEEETLATLSGVDGTDADGKRLDRREFKATINSLYWLSTCEMGQYNNNGRYRDDMLDVLSGRFEHAGLPEDHGITLIVEPDGQAWWAWRRTITGWCFAIGAAGPPPAQWLCDGSEPPQGPPLVDLMWGAGPWDPEASPNW